MILFEHRWHEIAGSEACYTGDRDLSAENQLFIALAQHIAKYFPERYPHYYKLLMPSIRNLHQQFQTTLIAVTDTPLNQLFAWQW